MAIYQTDLIGFAERYGALGVGGARAMTYLTRRIHTLVGRTLAPSTASLQQLESLAIPRLARWPRGVDLDAFQPGLRDEGLRRQLAPDGRLLVGYVDRLARDPEFRRRVARAARRSVEGRSWLAVNLALVAHYLEVVGTMTGYRELVA